MNKGFSAVHNAGNIQISTPINWKNPKRRKKYSEYMPDAPFNTAEEVEDLWKAVVMQALVDVTTCHQNPDLAKSKLEAMRWLTSNNTDFVDVCLRACLDPGQVRVMAKKAIANPGAWRIAAGKSLRYLERKAMRARKRFFRRMGRHSELPSLRETHVIIFR